MARRLSPGEKLHGTNRPVASAEIPRSWIPPKSDQETFHCFALRCSGVRAAVCCERQETRTKRCKENGPRFMYCHDLCPQGHMVRRAIGWKLKAPPH